MASLGDTPEKTHEEEVENGLVGWCTAGKLVEGRRLRDSSAALVVGWIEFIVGYGEYFVISAFVIHTRRGLGVFDPFWDDPSHRWRKVFGGVIDTVCVCAALLWRNARFHGVPLSHLATRMGIIRATRTTHTSNPTATGGGGGGDGVGGVDRGGRAWLWTVVTVVGYHAIGALVFWIHDQISDQIGGPSSSSMTSTSTGHVSLSNLRSWSTAQVVQALLMLPLKEEVLFRAVLIHRLHNRMPASPVLSVSISAALFGLIHLVNLRASPFSTFYVITQSLLAIVIGQTTKLQTKSDSNGIQL